MCYLSPTFADATELADLCSHAAVEVGCFHVMQDGAPNGGKGSLHGPVVSVGVGIGDL